jgi:hypothetical protein
VEGLHSVIYKKLDKLYKEFESPKTKDELYKIIRWLTDDRSLNQHRNFWAFLKYLHESVGQESEGLHNFKDRLFINMGLYKVVYKGTDRVYLVPTSVSFGKCGQKEFNIIFKQVQEFAETKLNIDYADWLQYYQQNPEQI